MIALGLNDDEVLGMEFLLTMSRGMEPIRTPERYIELRKARDTIREMVAGSNAARVEELRALVLKNIQEALVAYEDADPVKIVNDMMAKGRGD